MGHQTKRELRERIDRYVRNLTHAGLATEAELESVAKEYRERPSKDDLWEWLSELRSLTRARKATSNGRSGHKSVDALDAAIAALEGRAETVHLASIDKIVKVVPASWSRILIVEDIEWWMLQLGAAHTVFKTDETRENIPTHELEDLLSRIVEQLRYQRSLLFAQITAPTPRPVTTSVDWADDITPVEEVALLQAWHRVNTDTIAQLPRPRSKDGVRDLPSHWSFVFQSVAWRERRPPEEIINDRSLASIVASTVIEALKHEASGGGNRMGDEDEIAEALGADV